MRLPRFRKRATQPDELTCRELVRLVTDYLEGALSESDRRRFEAHLTDCDGCTTYLAQVRDTIRITGTLTEDSLASGDRDELLAAFRTWKHACFAGARRHRQHRADRRQGRFQRSEELGTGRAFVCERVFSILASTRRRYERHPRFPLRRLIALPIRPFGPLRNVLKSVISTSLPPSLGTARSAKVLPGWMTFDSVTVAVTAPGADQS